MKLNRKQILLLLPLFLLSLVIIFLIKKIYKPNDVKRVNRNPSAIPTKKERLKNAREREERLNELGPWTDPNPPKPGDKDGWERFYSTYVNPKTGEPELMH